MKKKLFTLISMFLPMMASAYDAGNSFDLSQSPWEGVAEYVSDFDSDSNVNKTRTAGAVNMSVIFTNVSNEDIYITGHMYIAVRTADDSDWGPIHVNLVPYSKGVAQYVIPAKTRAVIPPSMLDIFVNGNKEPVSKYYGGHIFYFSPGDPVYWRVYSWTTAHDPAVVKSTPGTFNFTNGGVIEFVLNRTDEAKEGRIVRSSNPTVLGGGSVTPQPQPQPEPQPQPQPQPEPQPQPQPEPQPQPQPEPQPVTQTCATPTITYEGGMLKFASTTEDATFNYVIFINGTGNEVSMELPLKLGVNVRANKTGYNSSEWKLGEFTIEGNNALFGDLTGDKVVDAADHVKLSDIILKQQPAENTENTEGQQTRAASEKCATPTIKFEDSKLSFSSETSDATFEYSITNDGGGNEVSVKLPLTFRVYVTAKKDGFDNSDQVMKEITIGLEGDLNGDGEVNDADHDKITEIIMEPAEQEAEQEPEQEVVQDEKVDQGDV